jgi:hypothetical protein
MSRRNESGRESPSASGGRGEGGGAPEPGKATLTQNLKSAPTAGAPLLGDLPTNRAETASTGPITLKVETDKKSPGGSNSRTTIGVGERIFVTNDPVTDGKFSSKVGKGKDEGTLYTWDAPDTAAKAIITFTPKDGGTPSTVEINVIEPESVVFQDKQALTYGKVSAAGMKVKVAFLPFTVSFANLDWQEKDVAPSVVEGWFKSLPADKVKHKKGPGGYLDAKNKAGDTAEWESSVVVKEESKLQWDIPQNYKVNGGAEKPVPAQPFTQLMTIDASGTTTVTKNGQTVTRKAPA